MQEASPIAGPAATKPTAWRRARVAARLWLRLQRSGLSESRCRLAHRLAEDPAVTNRLIHQAVASLSARKR